MVFLQPTGDLKLVIWNRIFYHVMYLPPLPKINDLYRNHL